MEKHIAVFSIPAHGHINPTLGLISVLVNRGYRVTFPTTDQFAQRVADSGANVIAYSSNLFTQAIRSEVEDVEKIQDDILDDAEKTISQLMPYYKNDRPDLVLYDRWTYAGDVLAAKLSVPAIQLCPTFLNVENFLPAEWISKFLVKLNRFLVNHELPERAGIEKTENLHIIFIPKEFQMNGDQYDKRYYFVGPCLINRSFYGDWEPSSENSKPVVLISLGTLFNNWSQFFKICIEVFSNSNWHVVMSVGGHIDPELFGSLPNNFQIYQYVSHLSVLAHARLYIGHGGINSTLESMFYGVPMLQIVEPQTEEEAVGKRVVELGLGVILLRAEVSSTTIANAVSKIYDDCEILPKAKRMKDIMQKKRGAEEAADCVDNYLNKQQLLPTEHYDRQSQ